MSATRQIDRVVRGKPKPEEHGPRPIPGRRYPHQLSAADIDQVRIEPEPVMSGAVGKGRESGAEHLKQGAGDGPSARLRSYDAFNHALAWPIHRLHLGPAERTANPTGLQRDRQSRLDWPPVPTVRGSPGSEQAPSLGDHREFLPLGRGSFPLVGWLGTAPCWLIVLRRLLSGFHRSRKLRHGPRLWLGGGLSWRWGRPAGLHRLRRLGFRRGLLGLQVHHLDHPRLRLCLVFTGFVRRPPGQRQGQKQDRHVPQGARQRQPRMTMPSGELIPLREWSAPRPSGLEPEAEGMPTIDDPASGQTDLSRRRRRCAGAIG